jgi:hypothetical protein
MLNAIMMGFHPTLSQRVIQLTISKSTKMQNGQKKSPSQAKMSSTPKVFVQLLGCSSKPKF